MQVLTDGLAKLKDKNLSELREIYNNSITEFLGKDLVIQLLGIPA